MKKKGLLAFLLAVGMLFTSVPTTQAAVPEDTGIAPASETILSDIYTVETIGKGKYELYAYTMSLGYVGEASIELSGITYVSGATDTEKNRIRNFTKELKITQGVMTRMNVLLPVSDTIPSKTVKLGSGVMSGRCRSQSTKGYYVVYAASHNTLICYGGDWSRSTYHQNPLISLTSE